MRLVKFSDADPDAVSDPSQTGSPALTNVVAPVPPFAIGKTPVTPVVRGKLVAFVNVRVEGVPRFGVTRTELVSRTIFPVPVTALLRVTPP